MHSHDKFMLAVRPGRARRVSHAGRFITYLGLDLDFIAF
jgi:hypothetical protein